MQLAGKPVLFLPHLQVRGTIFILFRPATITNMSHTNGDMHDTNQPHPTPFPARATPFSLHGHDISSRRLISASRLIKARVMGRGVCGGGHQPTAQPTLIDITRCTMDSERTCVLIATDVLSTKSSTQRRPMLGTRWKAASPPSSAGDYDHKQARDPSKSLARFRNHELLHNVQSLFFRNICLIYMDLDTFAQDYGGRGEAI